MELFTYSECACASCGHVIDYRASQAGEVVKCPKCGEQSRLPEPEKLTIVEVQGPAIPESKTCPICGNQTRFLAEKCPACELTRKRKVKLAWLAGSVLIVVLIVGLALAHPFWRSTTDIPFIGNPTNHGSFMLLEQPHPRLPKSIKDLRVGRFTLEKKRGSDLAIAVGDIENESENVHTSLRADLDVLDKAGAKIGTASDYFTELGPHQSWHFLVVVPETNALSVRFDRITEQ